MSEQIGWPEGLDDALARWVDRHGGESAALCDDDGMVRSGMFHTGTDYPCTGSAHPNGHLLLCSNPIHRKRSEGMQQARLAVECRHDWRRAGSTFRCELCGDRTDE